MHFRLLLRPVFLGLTWLLAPALTAADSGRPNFLLILADDLNDWVGFLGGHPQTRTPNLDRLAARGIVFANANCAVPLCAPSRAALFTGRNPERTGAFTNADSLPRVAPRALLLPQHLRQHGYRTLAAGKVLHHERPEAFDESFHPEGRWAPFDAKRVNYTAEELPSKATSHPRHAITLASGRTMTLPLNRLPSDRRPNDPTAESFDWGPVEVPDSEMGDTKSTDWAVARLGAGTDKPFLLAVGFNRPHIPLFAPARYFEPFPVGEMKLPPYLAHDVADLPATGRRIALEAATAGAHASVVRAGQWQAAIAAYLACVHFIDAQIGRLLAALEAGPHAANTVIVFCSDNGWHLGEKDHWGKLTGWERSVRVPLVIAPAPRDRAKFRIGTRSAQPVTLTDLFPTLLDYGSLPRPAEKLDGESLVPLLIAPERRTGRAVVSTIDRLHHSVRDERWRFIRYGDGGEELYDLESDPHEWHNLAAVPAHAATRARLAALLPRGASPPGR